MTGLFYKKPCYPCPLMKDGRLEGVAQQQLDAPMFERICLQSDRVLGEPYAMGLVPVVL